MLSLKKTNAIDVEELDREVAPLSPLPEPTAGRTFALLGELRAQKDPDTFELGERARRRVIEEHSFQRWQEGLRRIYRGILTPSEAVAGGRRVEP